MRNEQSNHLIIESENEYQELRARLNEYDKWYLEYCRLHNNGVLEKDIPKNLGVSNAERSAVEHWEFIHNPPEKYFLYVRHNGSELANQFTAITWTGQTLGRGTFGREFRDNFGGIRVPVWIDGINGVQYAGTYFKSSGDYARIKRVKSKGRN